MSASITLMPGDGIGPEVTLAAKNVMQAIADKTNQKLVFEEAAIGGAAMQACGEPLPPASLIAAKRSDAVFLGAVGGPQWSDPAASVRPEQGLLALRQELGVYANLRPVKPMRGVLDASPIKSHLLADTDFVVVRELTGGSYFGRKERDESYALDECVYHRSEIERVVRRACVLARTRRNKLTLVDKANVMATSRLWRSVTQQMVAEEFPEVELEILLVDAAAMHILSRPAEFDVIVTENMFGDILTDEASMLAGSLGVLPSASLGDGSVGLYEPIHGSAPDIAGSGSANPIGAILSAAMLLELSLGWKEAAQSVRSAVVECIDAGVVTPDLGGQATTQSMTAKIVATIGQQKLAAA